MKVQLKFKDSASSGAREDVLAKLASKGARAVDPLFPDSSDGYLQTLYMVDADDDRGELLALLEGEEAVEVAEPAVRRHLASS
jgi:hypothetical protein